MISIVMALIALATIGSGVVLAGAGFAPFWSALGLAFVIVAPLAMAMIGIPPREFIASLGSAVRAESSTPRQLAEAHAALNTWRRLLTINAGVFTLIGLIAMLVAVEMREEMLSSFSRGLATAITVVLYVLMIQGLVVHPLIARVKRAQAGLMTHNG